MSQIPSTPRSVENGQYDVVGKAQTSTFIIVINIVNTLTHLVLGAVALSAIFFANQFSQSTSLKQHIYLCVTGYIILMSQAVLAFNPQAGWTSMFKHQNKKRIHIVMQVAGSILALVGSIIRITAIDNHLETTHGILGIVAMVMTFVSLLGGLANVLSIRMKMNQIFVKIVHSCFGSLTLVIAFICLIFAFNKDLYRTLNGDINANLSISLAVIALVGTIMSACVNTFKRMFR